MEQCFPWLEAEYGLETNATLSEVNRAFRDWNMGPLVLICVLILPGILGNSLVVAIFYRDFRKSAYRTFVLWLASLDLAGCVIVMPYLMVNILTPVSMDNEIVCKLGRFLSHVIMMTSHFILVVIAADRYRKICKPHSLQIPQSQTSRFCLGMLLLSVVISVPAGVLYGNNSVPTGIPGLKTTRCFTAEKYTDSPAHLVYYIVINILGAIVTLFITLLYTKVILKIRQQFRERVGVSNLRVTDTYVPNGGSVADEKLNRKLVKTTWTLLAVTIVFVLTIFPHTVLALVDFSVHHFYCRLSFAEGFMFNLAMHFFLLNSVLNCVIYGFMDNRFQKKFLLLFRRQQFDVNNDPFDTKNATSTNNL